jgi:DNA-binding MarR family transcriptional regulator
VPTSRNASKRAVAAELWRLLAETFQQQFRAATALLQEQGLTPGHLKVLTMLHAGEALPMGSLAHGMGCDASTMTWLVDRLEERGLVERKMLPSDRRVKTVVLTADGQKTAELARKRMYEPPAEFLSLDEETLATLRDALAAAREEMHEKAATGNS